jgi:hypothetical protein
MNEPIYIKLAIPVAMLASCLVAGLLTFATLVLRRKLVPKTSYQLLLGLITIIFLFGTYLLSGIVLFEIINWMAAPGTYYEHSIPHQLDIYHVWIHPGLVAKIAPTITMLIIVMAWIIRTKRKRYSSRNI